MATKKRKVCKGWENAADSSTPTFSTERSMGGVGNSSIAKAGPWDAPTFAIEAFRRLLICSASASHACGYIHVVDPDSDSAKARHRTVNRVSHYV